ncbi:hypothetical protein ACJJTC_019715 [Scirpophaga incertulas]
MASGLIQFAFVLASGIINIMPNEVGAGASCLRDVKICGRCELRGGNCAAAAANLVTPPALPARYQYNLPLLKSQLKITLHREALFHLGPYGDVKLLRTRSTRT